MFDWFERAGLVVELVAVIVPTNPMHLPPRVPVQSLGSEASCPLNSCSENVIVEAIIIPELELRNVKWHIDKRSAPDYRAWRHGEESPCRVRC